MSTVEEKAEYIPDSNPKQGRVLELLKWVSTRMFVCIVGVLLFIFYYYVLTHTDGCFCLSSFGDDCVCFGGKFIVVLGVRGFG